MNEQAIAKRDVGAVVSLTPMQVLDNAIQRGATPDVIEKMMALQERWEANEARKAFDEAMAAAKAEIPVIAKNRHVGFDSRKAGGARTDYRHEDMAEIARTVDPILARHGLSYRYKTSSAVNEPVTVTCVVSHRLGHSEENSLSAPRDETGNKNSIQAVGSTITYLQRYTLKAALGLAAAYDDDGAKAEDTGPISEKQASELRALIDETGADIEKFCEMMNVEAVPGITVAQFPEAVAILRLKQKAKEAKAAQKEKADA